MNNQMDIEKRKTDEVGMCSARTRRFLLTVLGAFLVLLTGAGLTFAQGDKRVNIDKTKVTTVASTEVPPTPPLTVGAPNQPVNIPGPLNAYGWRMQVVDSPIGGGVLANNVYVRQLNQSASPAHLCWKVAPDHVPGLILTTCTSSESSIRYKTDIHPFLGGLDVISRLNPVNFAWKTGGQREVGLIAEEVEKIEPLLTYRNANDQIEGVKYENMSVLFVNAIKQQQTQIQALKEQIEAQQEQLRQLTKQIDALTKKTSP